MQLFPVKVCGSTNSSGTLEKPVRTVPVQTSFQAKSTYPVSCLREVGPCTGDQGWISRQQPPAAASGYRVGARESNMYTASSLKVAAQKAQLDLGLS